MLSGYCFYQLTGTKVFFESERILDEFKDESIEQKFLDDQNLIFYGIALEDSLTYANAKKIISRHNFLKKSSYTSKVYSINNDREVISGGLLPIVKKRLDSSSEESFKKSLQRLKKSKSNFITSDYKHLLFLVEVKKDLNTSDQKELIAELRSEKQLPQGSTISIAGRLPSELHFQKKVVIEFIIMTLVSALLCFLFLYLITTNIRLVVLTILSVIVSIVTALGISDLIFGGIELVMIITPAILFIVAISDIMHLTNNQSKLKTSKESYFMDRIDKIGKAVALTSITTGISFLTFLSNDIIPIVRFGIITSIGVVLTLFIAMVLYAIILDNSFHRSQPTKLLDTTFKSLISYFLKPKKSTAFHFTTALFIGLGIYASATLNIDNYLTDEINKKSVIYKETNYFDQHFGGIKPITISVKSHTSIDSLSTLKSDIEELGFVVDINSLEKGQLLKNIVENKEDNIVFMCRTKDEGSIETFSKLKKLETLYKPKKVVFGFGGAGYIFDQLGYGLTQNLLLGLLMAVLFIGLLFFVINKFTVGYFFVAVLPNIIPIMVCLGILQLFGFYFSLSNAFIFTIVFGLIIDDSIHLISAYTRLQKNGIEKEESLAKIVSQTGTAIIKTTLLVILCLLPLLFSEFKSVSQLAVITIISALIAVFFDLIYLPRLMRKIID